MFVPAVIERRQNGQLVAATKTAVPRAAIELEIGDATIRNAAGNDAVEWGFPSNDYDAATIAAVIQALGAQA